MIGYRGYNSFFSDRPNIILPAAITKAGVLVSIRLCVCVNKPKSCYGDLSYSVDIACRLLQYNPHCGSEGNNRQATWVLNAAARVVSETKKFDQGLSRLMHQELHWLDIPERVNYKLGVLTHRCLLGKAPVYLSNCYIPVSQVASRRHLRSAARHQLTVPRHHLSTYGRRAFAVAGPTMFNTLPDDLRDPAVSTATFGQSLKTPTFSLPISTFNAFGGLT